jgi:hypothetical protein
MPDPRLCGNAGRPGAPDPSRDAGLGQDQALAVIPLCRSHHSAFDRHELDLLPYQGAFKEELAFAVYRSDLISVLERLTGCRWHPAEKRAA